VARSTPSPMAATSRRIACPTVIMESLAAPSGSEKRIATCAIACAIMRISWPRPARLGEAGEEREQQPGGKKQRGKPPEYDPPAALADRGLQRADEADGEQHA